MTAALDLSPGSAEWAKLLTASRFGRLFGGPGAWRSLRREMLGLAGERFTDEDAPFSIRHGRENEPRARFLYEIETGYTVTVPGFRSLGSDARVGCTLDGLAIDAPEGRRPLEIKCPTTLARHILAHQGLFDEAYRWQVLGGLWIYEDERADFVSFSPTSPAEEALAIVPVYRDERAIARLRDTVCRFLDWFEAAGDGDAIPPTHQFLQPGAAIGVPKLF